RPIGDSDLFRMLEVTGKIACARIAILRITLERAIDDFLQLLADLGINLTRRNGIVQQTVIHDQERIRAGKWDLPCKHFVEYDAQRVEVAAGVAALALDLFR